MRRGLEWALYGIVRFVDMNECNFAVLLSICHSVLLVCLLDVTKLTMQHAACTAVDQSRRLGH
jgi:hypothetical protein